MDEKKKTLPKREYKRAGSQFMIGKQWIFIKDGLDDFRDGLPPPSDQDVIINVGYIISTQVTENLAKTFTKIRPIY